MTKFKRALIDFSVNHHRLAALAVVMFTIAMCCFFPKIQVDTDPENMLPLDDPDRVFHNTTKKEFVLSETVVVGIVNKQDPNGVFNPDTLKRVYELTEFAKTLRWPDEQNPGETSGVIEVDMVAPSLVDHMSQAGPGEISFEWLMVKPPETRKEARRIRDKAFSNPMLAGRMFSRDEKVICIFLPLTDKHLSYRVNEELMKKITEFTGDEIYHIAGVPVAEVAVGVEMFSQMAVGSPLAMAVLLGLLMLFFRKWRLVILPLMIATFAVMSTMGLMIALGFQVHILSSMIPIFLMCIGTVSTIHILSEFFDIYTREKGKRETIREVMQTLFVPILYTSLTTAGGFASLTCTPIPPAQIFGAFLSIGVMIAWLYTVIFAPAYIMMIPEHKLAGFGMSAGEKGRAAPLTRILRATGNLTFHHPRALLAVIIVASAVAVWGNTQIRINDNYAKRFAQSHPIRQADIALNRHLDGTYTAYLVLEGQKTEKLTAKDTKDLAGTLDAFADGVKAEYENAPKLAHQVSAMLPALASSCSAYDEFIDAVTDHINWRGKKASDDDFYAYSELASHVAVQKEHRKTFKRPEILRYMKGLQQHMEASGLVGKTTSVADAVCKVNQEMIDGDPENYRIPERLKGVSECYFQFQQGHRRGDLWHMVTPDYMSANLWMQLKNGDSADMKHAVREVDDYLRENPPPAELSHRWAGLHYINLVLQERLIPTMLRSLLGSFVLVFFMMSFLFRSFRWGLLCMVPLTVTILMIYGIVGLSGKDYDLPIAVLGVLTLGMAVDFAIHFLQRAREKYGRTGPWERVNAEMFGEPARAISRNVLVIAIGFLPLMVAPLVPYKTMGLMLFAIMTLSGIITLLVLPAILAATEKWFFNPTIELMLEPGSNSVAVREKELASKSIGE